MKYATLLLGLAILMANVVVAKAAEQIPAQYHGYWCEIEPAQNQSLYKRCREPDSEAAISIRARDIECGEGVCKLLAITAIPGGHKVRARCQGTYTDQGPFIQVEHWRLSPNGRRLEVRTD
jgi:hypothetical protein